MRLLGRDDECASIDSVIDGARTGFSGVLLLRGEAGIGKTALLDYAADRAADLRVVRISGIEWEMGLGYAGLHQLTLPFLGRLDTLPTPQRRAMRVAFGMELGTEPNPFMVALAVLTLIADIASTEPLLCIIDDVQWIDEESVGALAFVARRLHADRVAMLFAVREPSDQLPILDGFPTLEIRGLPEDSARELLTSVVQGNIGRQVADRVVWETLGNPLGLIALGGELTHDQLAGGALPEPLPLSQRVESRFRQRINALTPATQTLLLVAAADPTGRADLLWLAGDRLGFGAEEAAAGAINELLNFGPPVTFRHPLMRSAAYYGASSADRQRIHETLAAVTDPDRDPDRWAWHLGLAAVGPDERTANALEHAAERGRSRGGFSGAATLLARAAELTADRRRRAERLLAAAEATVMAGVPQRSQSLLERAIPDLVGASRHAEALRVRGETLRLLFDSGATAALMRAARALEPFDVRKARGTWLAALEAEILAQRDIPGASLRHVAEQALSVAAPVAPTSVADLLLDGLSSRIAISHTAAVPILREALAIMRTDEAYVDGKFQSAWWLGDVACRELWDDLSRREMLDRLTQACRQHGALFLLSVALLAQFERETWVGEFGLAQALFEEGREITADIGMDLTRWDLFKVTLLAWQGRDAETRVLVDKSVQLAADGGVGALLHHAYTGLVIMDLASGQYAEAFEYAHRIYLDDPPGYGTQILPELVEAAGRSNNMEVAQAALDRLSQRAQAAGTPLALGLLARSRALIADNDDADPHFRESLEQLSRTESRPEIARARLFYGEWLRRRRRRREAREHLRVAYQLFESVGASAFTERARTELAATGESARVRTVDTQRDLTPQEERIARFAASGATNPEIAAQMFLSASTVEYHLRKIFRKLDLSSRRQLKMSLQSGD